MKKYIYNKPSKRYIDADGVKGKKIIKELLQKKQKIIYYKDNKGSQIIDFVRVRILSWVRTSERSV